MENHFENALLKLQEAVKKLESGELTLEQSLRCFEEGVAQAKTCQQVLKAAEQKVELLLKAGQNAAGETQIETQTVLQSQSSLKK